MGLVPRSLPIYANELAMQVAIALYIAPAPGLSAWITFQPCKHWDFDVSILALIAKPHRPYLSSMPLQFGNCYCYDLTPPLTAFQVIPRPCSVAYSTSLCSPSCLQRASAHHPWMGVCTHPLDLMPMWWSVQTWNWIRFCFKKKKKKLAIVSWEKLFTPATEGQELILKGSLKKSLCHLMQCIKASALW